MSGLLRFPRIQLRTIGQLLAGVAIERPSGNVAVDETFKKAPKAKAKGGGSRRSCCERHEAISKMGNGRPVAAPRESAGSC